MSVFSGDLTLAPVLDEVLGNYQGDAGRMRLTDLVALVVSQASVTITGAQAYPTTTAGLSATGEGGYFSVAPGASNPEVAFIIYRKVSGAALEITRIPSSAIVAGIASRVTVVETESADSKSRLDALLLGAAADRNTLVELSAAIDAVRTDLKGGVAVARDSLQKLSAALDAAVTSLGLNISAGDTAVVGGASVAYNTLGKVEPILAATKAAVDAILAGAPGDMNSFAEVDAALDAISAAIAGKAAAVHDHTAGQITDATPLGRSLLTAVSAAAVRAAIEVPGTGVATTSAPGLLSPADKAKLDAIAAGAQPNAVASVAGKTGPVTLTKADVGLAAADNTADLDKPISTAVAAALAGKASTSLATPAAPGLLSAADKSKLDGVTAGAQPNAVTSVAGRQGAVALAKADVGLSNVDNTSDANKPVSGPQAAALATKADVSALNTKADGVATAAALATKANASDLATKADISALTTETNARVSADSAIEAKADQALALVAPYASLKGRAYDRPGDAPHLFSNQATGKASAKPALQYGVREESAALGAYWRVRPEDIDDPTGWRDFAAAVDLKIEDGRTYLVYFEAVRLVDPPTPQPVALRWQNLNGAGNAVSAVTLRTAANPTVAGGPFRLVAFIGKAGAPVPGGMDELDYTIPPTTVYGAPVGRVFSNGQSTALLALGARDVTEDISGGVEVSELTARIAAAESAVATKATIEALDQAKEESEQRDAGLGDQIDATAGASLDRDQQLGGRIDGLDMVTAPLTLNDSEKRLFALVDEEGGSPLAVYRSFLRILKTVFSAPAGGGFRVLDDEGYSPIEARADFVRLRDLILRSRSKATLRVVDPEGRSPFEIANGFIRMYEAKARGTSRNGLFVTDDEGFRMFGVDGRGVAIGRMRLRVSERSKFGLRIVDEEGFVGASFAKAGEPTTPPDPEVVDLDPIVAPDVYLIESRPLTLYADGATVDRASSRRGEIALRSLASSAGGRVFSRAGEEIALDPALLGSTAVVSARPWSNGATRLVATQAVRVAPATGRPARKVLAIGDSITNRAVLKLIGDKLTAAGGQSITWLGTIQTSLDPANNNAANGPLGEAREGRTVTDYVYRKTDVMTPVAPGDEAAYLAANKATKRIQNPFVVASAASNAINGFAWDFGQYLSRFGVASPDVVLIGLGHNDAIQYTDTTAAVAGVAEGVVHMLDAIRAWSSTVPVGLWMAGTPRSQYGDPKWPRQAAIIRKLIEIVRTRADANVRVVQAWAQMDLETGFEVATTATSASGVATGYVADWTHPITTARDQLAEALAAFIACN